MAPASPPPRDHFPEAFWIGPITQAAAAGLILLAVVLGWISALTMMPQRPHTSDDVNGWGYLFDVVGWGIIGLGLVGLLIGFFYCVFVPAWLASLICAIVGAKSYRQAPPRQHRLIWLATGLGGLVTIAVTVGLSSLWFSSSGG